MTATPIEEKILLQQVADGDGKAFHALYTRYSPRIYSLGMHLTHNPILAEELVQDIFEKLWKKRDTLPAIDHFPAYLKAMIRNTANDHLRRMARERLLLKDLAHSSPEGEHSTEKAMEQGLYARLWREAIDSLPPRTRQVYLLSRSENQKNAEIAEQLGISIYTVKEHMHKALASIRDYFEGRVDLLVVAAMLCYFP